MYSSLFSPIKINSIEIKNRIIYPALALLYADSFRLNERLYSFYREIARGGAGIVTVGPVGFCPEGRSNVALQLDENTAEDFRIAARIIKSEGARAWMQIFHAGAYSVSEKICGQKAIAPSAVYSNFSRAVPEEMTIDQIECTRDEFIKTALLAQQAGFDGVEIIASAGYLITQFLSPVTNKREDHYGGCFENRVRFPREIIEGMRCELGEDYPVTVRMAGNDFVKGSNDSTETVRFAEVYEHAGADLISVTGGWHESGIPQLSMDVPAAAYAYLAENIKKSVNIPVAASNRINSPELAEKIIKQKSADMVNLGRVLIADPYWPKKAKEGNSHIIRKCIACNQGCTDNLFGGEPVKCILNAEAGFENERRIEMTASPKKIIIAGSGPAALEAAVRAHEAGHSVEIYERDKIPGGQLNIACCPPGKSEIRNLTRYYMEMIRNCNIPLYLNTELTPELVKEKTADLVIAATGGSERNAQSLFKTEGEITSSWEVLAKNIPVGRNVAVIGGSATGLETAHFIAAENSLSPDELHFLFTSGAESTEKLTELCRPTVNITVFEREKRAGSGIGRSTRWIILQQLARLNVNIITEAEVTAVINGRVFYSRGDEEAVEQFDTVINSTGTMSEKSLAESLAAENIRFIEIGDCTEPGTIGDAIHSAYLAVKSLNK